MKFNYFIALLVSSIPFQAIKAETLVINDMIEHALQNSPITMEISHNLKNKQTSAYELQTINNPEVGFNFSLPNSGNGNHAAEIEFEQTLKLSNLGARKQYANAFIETASIEERAQILELVHSVMRGYATYWLLQEQTALLKKKIAYSHKKQQQVEKAASQGRIDIADAKLLKAEALRLAEKLRVLNAQKQSGLANLMHLAGLNQKDFHADLSLDLALPSLNTLTNLAANKGGVLELVRARKKLAEQRYKVAKEDAGFSRFTPKAAIQRNFNENNTTLVLGVSIELPIWDSNNAELARANAELNLAKASLNTLNSDNFKNVITAAFKKAKSTQLTAANYRNKILPIWKDVQNITEQKFAYGQASIFDLLQMHERLTEIQNEALQAELNVIEARIELESLVGQSFSFKERH